MIITRYSMMTGILRQRDLDITAEEWADYQSGTLIQHAMPRLSNDDREFILTGTTPEEWADHLGPEPDAEDDGQALASAGFGTGRRRPFARPSCRLTFIAVRRFNSDTGRTQWSVLHMPTAVYYSPNGRGKKAAIAYAKRLNLKASAK